MADWIDSGDFEQPVHLVMEGDEIEVSTTREAAEMLLYKWPIGETGIRIQARMACMRVLGGSEPPETARRAFADAAKEADILDMT